MGWIIDLSERGGDVKRFDEAIKMAKSGIKEACEIWEDMKSDFSERGSYHDRYMPGYDERRYYGREWDDMRERRMRDSMGRYR